MNLAILRWIMRGAVENWRTRSSMLGPGAATVYKALARGACAARGGGGGEGVWTDSETLREIFLHTVNTAALCPVYKVQTTVISDEQ